ncbi:MAG: hypothetical protein IJM21_07375 [Clostridia bacterium]|nr:hypothetical protein [Clostridia bacterium]
MRLFHRDRAESPERIYTLKTENGRGRTIILAHVAINQVITWLTTGMFYTSFLMIYGIDIVNVGIITFIPYIASLFGVFSPSVLERFKKRRVFLAVTRLLYYLLQILGLTLAPVIIKDPDMRIVALIVIIFLANVINAITGSGYTLWHIKFVPPGMRADYFSIQSLVANTIGIGASLISGVVADALSSSPYADAAIIGLRYTAFALAMIDVILLCLPKEFAYEHSKQPKLRDIFSLPFHSRPFLMTMAVIVLFTFFNAIPSSSLSYYLINDVGIEYTFVYALNMAYPLVQLFLLPVAKKYVRKHGWFETFALFTFCSLPTWLMYSCVTASNYLWLYAAVRLIQHLFGTFYNLANANLVYTNLPPKDQTNYLSFHTIAVNAATFLGMMAGTGFVAWCGDRTVELFGLTFTSVQMLLWAQSAGYVLLPLFILLNLKTLKTNNY